MAVSAELGAIDLISPFLSRAEPNGYTHARDGILGHPQCNRFEGVDDIPRRNMNDNRPEFAVGILNQRHVDLVQPLHVVFAMLVFGVNAEDIFRRHEAHVLPTELTILARVPDVPKKLLSYDLNPGRFTLI